MTEFNLNVFKDILTDIMFRIFTCLVIVPYFFKNSIPNTIFNDKKCEKIQ